MLRTKLFKSWYFWGNHHIVLFGTEFNQSANHKVKSVIACGWRSYRLYLEATIVLRVHKKCDIISGNSLSLLLEKPFKPSGLIRRQCLLSRDVITDYFCPEIEKKNLEKSWRKLKFINEFWIPPLDSVNLIVVSFERKTQRKWYSTLWSY